MKTWLVTTALMLVAHLAEERMGGAEEQTWWVEGETE